MGADSRQQEARGREEGQVIGVSVSPGGQQATSSGHSTAESSGVETTTAQTAGDKSALRIGLPAFRESLRFTYTSYTCTEELCAHVNNACSSLSFSRCTRSLNLLR